MSKASLLDEFKRRRVSAIIRTNDADLATEAMRAAVAGGFRMVEFTLTTPNAFELIQEFAKNGELMVGAGTVMTPEQADRAVQAGAKFIVSPIFDLAVVAKANALDVLSIPGTFTATEMSTAHRGGADVVKLFPAPADVAGYVRAILGPMSYLNIFPTAGVTPDNFLEVLAAGAVGVGFVRSLFDPDDLARRDFAVIERRAATIIGKI